MVNFWAEHYKEDLTDFINRDKNHPCIFIWSIGNEVLKMRSELTKELMEIVRSVDQSRLITCGVNDVTEVSDSNRAVLELQDTMMVAVPVSYMIMIMKRDQISL